MRGSTAPRHPQDIEEEEACARNIPFGARTSHLPPYLLGEIMITFIYIYILYELLKKKKISSYSVLAFLYLGCVEVTISHTLIFILI